MKTKSSEDRLSLEEALVYEAQKRAVKKNASARSFNRDRSSVSSQTFLLRYFWDSLEKTSPRHKFKPNPVREGLEARLQSAFPVMIRARDVTKQQAVNWWRQVIVITICVLPGLSYDVTQQGFDKMRRLAYLWRGFKGKIRGRNSACFRDTHLTPLDSTRQRGTFGTSIFSSVNVREPQPASWCDSED